jgi:tetratricopeptide (TPR) repeat protein/tRNA A-37 threonylcarbamoyl transferase component Bud32
MASDPLIGTTVGGCEILEVIGQGGMGVIYKARQKSLDRIVALKVLARHLATDINFVSRFQKEARAIAKVNHPNILAVYDVGDDSHTNYMIMELIDGQSLAELQSDRRGAIPWEEASDYIRQSAQGLEAAQAAGIIHRDIKPENLMLTKKNVIKVSDFGLAKESDASTGNTSVDAVMGTPAFMSPEQCDGKKVDARSDIYSLGGTFYRLVSGRLPFEAETAMSMMYRHKHEALIPPHEIVPTVPQAVSTVIVKMMAKKREQRYQTMTEVIDAVDAARKPATSQAAPAVLAPAPARNVAPVPVNMDFGGGSAIMPPPAPVEPPPERFAASSEDTGNSGRMRAAGQSGRMPVQPGMPVGFGHADSSSHIHMPTSVMGMTGVGLAAPDEGYTNVSRGDELLGRGDRLAGLKYYRHALKSTALDQATRSRVEQELQKEVDSRRQAAESLLKRGMLVEASRECRVLVELDPADEFSKQMLKDLDSKLSLKRTMVNDIRQAIAASQFERAIKIWEGTSPELRDESLGKQVDQLRSVVVPALKLAEQGDNLTQQGRLEEAISSYEDAIKINGACEPARMGLKEAEQKVQRIEYMLKEGFQASLEQNYEKAVETWKPILQLRPNHPQAVKSMVDAYMAHAQNLRAHGDLEGALVAYKGAAETDKENRTVRRGLEELTNLRDKEQALIDRAQDAAARNRLGEAVGYWKEVQRINPTSKKASQQISQLSRQRSGGLLKATLVLAVLAAVVGGGYEFYYEHNEITAATEMIKQGRFAEARERLAAAHIYIEKSEKDALMKEAEIEVEVEAAKKLEAGAQWPEAEMAYRKLGERFGDDKKRQSEMLGKAAVSRAQHSLLQGTLALTAGKYAEASDHFREIRLINKGGSVLPDFLPLEERADRATTLADKLSHAERASDVGTRLKERVEARKLAEELGFNEIRDAIDKQMKTEGVEFNPEKAKALADEAKAALQKQDYDEAEKKFIESSQGGPQDETVKRYLLYISDVKSCRSEDRELYSKTNPVKTGNWGNDDRGETSAFCIDRYEYPNKEKELPLVNVSFLDAQAKCKQRGADLCTKNQWESVCKGETRINMFPYGADPDDEACNTKGSTVAPSGSKPKCKTSLGIFDMSGNAAEWVTDNETAWIAGGSFKSTTKQAGCLSGSTEKNTMTAPDVGFRCCRKLK